MRSGPAGWRTAPRITHAYGENQFLFEVAALPCDRDEIAASRAQTEQHAEDRLHGRTGVPGDGDHTGVPSA